MANSDERVRSDQPLTRSAFARRMALRWGLPMAIVLGFSFYRANHHWTRDNPVPLDLVVAFVAALIPSVLCGYLFGIAFWTMMGYDRH